MDGKATDEEIALANYAASVLADDIQAVLYLVSTRDYNSAANRMVTLSQNHHILAGHLSRLVDVSQPFPMKKKYKRKKTPSA
jgi:hypothetical protein